MSDAEGGAATEEAAVAKLDAQAQSSLRTCRTCCRQGLNGLAQLQKTVNAARGAPWTRLITLNDAVKVGSFACLRYLVDEVQVETLNVKTEGYYPLQLSVIWGKVDIMVYLFSRGADPMLEGELSVVNTARLRQQRLQEALARSGDGAEFEGFSITRSQIEPLIEEGRAMLQVLEGIEASGSYAAWAENNGAHPLVKRFSSHIRSSEPRFQLVVLRSLVLASRASLRSAAERAAMAADEAAQAAARAREEQPLMDALLEAGFSTNAAKEIRDYLKAPTVKALRAARLSSEEIEARLEAPVRQKRLMEGERRRFTRFVRELEEPAAAPAAAAPSKAAAKAAPKSKAKAAANPALLAMVAKGAGGGSAAKVAPAKSSQARKGGAIDSMALLFSDTLPSNAFMIITCFLFGL
mmetsp:Transcript_81758/g.226464  ORF Transcript_81758/g.226464 Transcript_81758/m.226464 type:complete len:409 (-) Transcript_81758:151-1377(-)|eukprot:CAMPEP_0179064368 /NCGR_PEP_ID=MMETSP0796-20121207/27914_1 /TAXON_ID=73915 /ORGANISM="Pyrodinium bahamense, Strain pbaha01" /LENGTH=408 /DNA_ID=CAMNT_0020761317 /DNA_START=110 /DNA_END=1336 /DNA_ORIENTATION=-